MRVLCVVRVFCLSALSGAIGCVQASPPVSGDLTVEIATDLARPDLYTCTLGVPDHCGSCTSVCPPGRDTAGTRRTCSEPGPFGVCEVICLGEWYDADNNLGNGCEAEDAPLQDEPAKAVAVTVPDQTGPMQVLAQIFSDARQHAEPPSLRPVGRDDWFALTVVGTGSPTMSLGACLVLSSFPTDAVFQLCLSDPGRTDFSANSCRLAMGRQAVCVSPPSGGDAGGPYHVRIQKVAKGPSGPHRYTLQLQH